MKLSVIIPIFNTEKYLVRCIDSILSQEFKDLEIILVDDGSTDSSPTICNMYDSKYNNIKVCHIKNSGPATAKNIGYNIAEGDYISFIDSDDEIRPNMYSKLIGNECKNDADVICCSYEQIDEFGNKTHNNSTGRYFVLNQFEAINNLLKKELIYSQCWTKIYKRKTLSESNIRFIDGLNTEEDFIFNLQVFMKSKIIVVIDEPLYIYTHRSSSLSRKYHITNLNSFLKNMCFRLELTDKQVKSKFPELKSVCNIHCIQYYNLMIGRAANFDYKASKKYSQKAFCYIKKHYLSLLLNHYKCGFSFIGAILILTLPRSLYFKYRKAKLYFE